MKCIFVFDITKFYPWSIFICDISFFASNSNIANYGGGNTPYPAKRKLMNVSNNFEKDSDILLKWFKKNFLKVKPEKYHLILSTDKNNALREGEFFTINSKYEKLLGRKTDSHLSCENHVKSLCINELKA